jgi:hypothetical protein
VVGQMVFFTAAVNPLPQGSGSPTGTVSFKDGTTTLGTGVLHANSNGTGSLATFTISTLAQGTHAITVVYDGDTNFKTSTSAALTQTVNAPGSATPLVSFANPSVIDPARSLPAVVSGQERNMLPIRFAGQPQQTAGSDSESSSDVRRRRADLGCAGWVLRIRSKTRMAREIRASLILPAEGDSVLPPPSAGSRVTISAEVPTESGPLRLVEDVQDIRRPAEEFR